MAEVDPETLLEWLSMSQGDERDMQLIALEQLCMLLLMSDNVDRCFECCPPRTFLPALCRIFLDELAPENVLEVTARAITYYLDVSAECTRRVVAMEGAVKAICSRLSGAGLGSRTSLDLAEQCIKVLELVCAREAGAVFEAGGLPYSLCFIREHGARIHRDTLHSAMAVVTRLCGKIEPQDKALPGCVEALSTLLKHEDAHVADGALRCFASLADRFSRRGTDPAPLACNGLVSELLYRLSNAAGPSTSIAATSGNLLFKIGRSRDNDEIILDTMVSRRHCIFRCEGNGEWSIKDMSSSLTFVNGVPLSSGISQRIYDGDTVQFSTCNEFKYVFTLDTGRVIKKPKVDEKIFDNVLIEQRTFATEQERQRNVLKNQIETKQREQDELKFRLELLLRQQDTGIKDKEDFKTQITTLEGKIETGNQQAQHLQTMYFDLLEKLENERVQFEARLNKEKQKWQAELSMSKQEKDTLEVKMKEQMEKWREEQQTEWKNLMENRVKEEKNIQAQLLSEKTVLEEKLKETEKALKQQVAKEDTLQNGSTTKEMDSCIFVEILNKDDPSKYDVLDTIDLTEATQPNVDTEAKEELITKVSDIMDEQLTCSICSELFVKATTLNCTHTFCQYCINCWNKKRKECPVCRSPVSSMTRSIVLDNFIESMLDNLPMELKNRRKEIIQERKALERKKKIH